MIKYVVIFTLSMLAYFYRSITSNTFTFYDGYLIILIATALIFGVGQSLISYINRRLGNNNE